MRESMVETQLQERESSLNQRKNQLIQHQSGVSDIMTQRDRIHDQIKNIRRHYMSERSHYID
jgi:hypothetical protein